MCQHVYHRSVETLSERPSGSVLIWSSLMLSISDVSVRPSWAWHVWKDTHQSAIMLCLLKANATKASMLCICSVNFGYAGREHGHGQRTHPLRIYLLECGTSPQVARTLQKRIPFHPYIDINTWEDIAVDRFSWRHALKLGIWRAEELKIEI